MILNYEIIILKTYVWNNISVKNQYKIYEYGSGYEFSNYVNCFESEKTNLIEVWKEYKEKNDVTYIYNKIENVATGETIIIKDMQGEGSDIEIIPDFKKYFWDNMQNKKYIDKDIVFENEKFVQTKCEGLPYFYGYKWKHNLTKEEKKIAENILKEKTYDEIFNSTLSNDIRYAYKKFDKYMGLDKYDIIVYPEVSHNNLVKVMIDLIKERFEKQKDYKHYKAKFYEIKKTDPKIIKLEYDEKRAYNQEDIKSWLDNIKKLDYFSIAKNGGKYRREARDFLEIEDKDLIKDLKNARTDTKILIVDDINTTGSTIREILRKIKAINENVNIEIFTYIGKKGGKV